MHYARGIHLFGAPNGLCSSITESKHIKAVKEPWRRSSRFNALGQMLLTNQRLDKLAASHNDFKSRGMLKGTCLSQALLTMGSHEDSNMGSEDGGVVNNARDRDGSDGEDNNTHNGENVDDDDDGAVSGPPILAHINLAKTPCKSI